MQYYILSKYNDNKTIYGGYYNSLRECLEDAVNNNVELSHVNLKNHNLTNANLDGAIMPYANFSGSNLTGANISEATINNAIFNNCCLYNTCIACSMLKNSDFRGASFGATIVDGADISNCKFSTLSSFDLDFIHTVGMSGCTYLAAETSEELGMSNPPIVIKGALSSPIVILDNTIKIGDKIFCKSILQQIMHISGFYLQEQAVQ